MDEKRSTLDRLVDSSLIAVIRLADDQRISSTVAALRNGGISCLEIAMTTPGALQAVQAITEQHPDILLGTGTVLDGSTARQAILAGARFLVTPTFEPEVIRTGNRYGVVTIVGAMTPTEILAAWTAGADLVKVFPASVLGPGYLRAIRGPLPQIPLVPTGGITADNAADFLCAGAQAVCAGGWLSGSSIAGDDRANEITRRAKRLVDAVIRDKE